MIPFYNTSGGANRTVEEALVYKTKKYQLFDTSLISDIFKRVLNKKVIGFEKPLNVGLPHVSYVVHLEENDDLFFRANLGPKEQEIQLLKEQVVSDVARAHVLPANHIIHVDISRNVYPFDFQIDFQISGASKTISSCISLPSVGGPSSAISSVNSFSVGRSEISLKPKYWRNSFVVA